MKKRKCAQMIPMKISREEKVKILERIKTYFEEERSETIGIWQRKSFWMWSPASWDPISITGPSTMPGRW
jgi:hypothetical protein